MKTVKWVLIAMILMIFAYAIIHAIISFLWMIYVGSIAFVVVLIVIAYIKIRNWAKRNKEN